MHRCVRADPLRDRTISHSLLICVMLTSGLAGQVTVFPVVSNTPAALEAAIVAANARVFQTSAAQPVVIEFASNLIGQTISLAHALPVLVVDHVTLRVAGAVPSARVRIDASNAPTAFRIASRHALIENIAFQMVGTPTAPSQDVFSAAGTEDLTISNCSFEGATANGLWLIGATSTRIQDCQFRDSAAGLVLTAGSSGASVVRCLFANNQHGVLCAVAHDLQFGDCVFDSNHFAFDLVPVCSDVLFGPGNVVRNSTGNALIAGGAVRLQITGNQFVDNLSSAVVLVDLCADVTLHGNVLDHNGGVSAHQLLVHDCYAVSLQGLQCTNGGAGVSASATRLLNMTGSAASPILIAANNREGISLNGCTDVLLDQVTVLGNVQAISGVQVVMIGCQQIDVVRSTIGNATGPGDIGLRIADSQAMRVGLGTSVLDHGSQGILISQSSDLALGNWAAGPGSLSVRGPTPLQLIACTNVQVAGEAGAECTLSAGPPASNIAVPIGDTAGARLGPFLVIDAGQAAGTAVQITDSAGTLLDGVSVSGHTGWGITASGSVGLQIRGCTVDGGAGAQPAIGEGLLLNPGCHGAQLWGNLVRRQQGGAFLVRDSDDVWLGPGNRAIDNAGDGFAVTDSGSGPATRRVTLQSSAAIGRSLASQVGFRFAHVNAMVSNVTATRNGTGVLLHVGAMATLVNTISSGNTADRNRDPGSSGLWRHGVLGTSSGSGGPGSWSDANMLVGVNPQFVSPAAGDVRLTASSPAVDAGLHATPIGSGLPSADADLLPRIRGGVVDRGAYEFAPLSGTGNSLDLVGPWLRPAAQSELVFSVRSSPAQAGQYFLVLVGGSGTGPGSIAPGGSSVPLVADTYTSLLLTLPQWCLGVLDGTGSGAVTIPITPYLVPYLPELSFSAVIAGVGPPTNPVVVRYVQ